MAKAVKKAVRKREKSAKILKKAKHTFSLPLTILL